MRMSIPINATSIVKIESSKKRTSAKGDMIRTIDVASSIIPNIAGASFNI
jgi:ribosomal protein S19